MAVAPLRKGLQIVGIRAGGNRILAPKVNVFELRAAFISGKSMKTETYQKPKPWPYMDKGYTNIHAFFDGTLKRLDENSKVIVVEGMPGLGKTELAKSIAEEFEMKHFPMITMDHYYINPYGYDMRQLDPQLPKRHRSYDMNNFVKNPKCEQAAWMQFTLYYMKYMQYIDALAHLLNTGEGVVLERSVYSDYVFLETMFSLGLVNTSERKAYYLWKDNSLLELMKPHLVIYLDASPATVEEKLKQRGRGEEKVFNKQFLELLEHNYKQQFLKSISEHAELLVYDWTTPGEAEIVAEDIERVNFDRFDKHDPKMADWRLKDDWDWSDRRWTYTNNRDILSFGLLHRWIEDVPSLKLTGEESKICREVWESAPGMEYNPGFNANMGDKGILFKRKARRPDFYL